MTSIRLQGKVFIRGIIELLTGLHLGGYLTVVDPTAPDSPVVKTPQGVPYIPGSALRGKMRCLIERTGHLLGEKYLVATGPGPHGKPVEMHICDDPRCIVCEVFGRAAGAYTYYRRSESGEVIGDGRISIGREMVRPSRLIVRDAYLDTEHFKTAFPELAESGLWTELKAENQVDRLTSVATPREVERVPAGARFRFEFVFSLYEPQDTERLSLVFEAMDLVEAEYLGAFGSRGYGRMRFADIEVIVRSLDDYRTGAKGAAPLGEPMCDLTALRERQADLTDAVSRLFNAAGAGNDAPAG